LAHGSSGSANDSRSDNDFSLGSSSSEQEEEYTVEEILAEQLFDDSEPRFWVKWESYGEERCGIGILNTPSTSAVWISHFLSANKSCQDISGSLLNPFLVLKAFKTGQRSALHAFSSLMMSLKTLIPRSMHISMQRRLEKLEDKTNAGDC
jgi:hypothetical protein